MNKNIVTIALAGGMKVKLHAKSPALDMLLRRAIRQPPAVPRPGDYWAAQGGYYAGVMRDDEDGDYHLIVAPDDLPGEYTWKDAVEAAKEYGHLPTQRECALIRATCSHLFGGDWYWSGTEHASSANYSWYQRFSDGSAASNYKTTSFRVRPARRLKI